MHNLLACSGFGIAGQMMIARTEADLSFVFCCLLTLWLAYGSVKKPKFWYTAAGAAILTAVHPWIWASKGSEDCGHALQDQSWLFFGLAVLVLFIKWGHEFFESHQLPMPERN